MSLYSLQYVAREWLVGRAYALHRILQRPTRGTIVVPRRVLIIVTGLIGDTVMCTPTIIAARHAWPHARISVLAFPPGAVVLRGLPAIDDIVETRVVPFTIRHRAEIRELKKQLAAYAFDVAIILLGDQFAATLAEIGIPVRVGVRGHPLAPALTHEYDLGPRRSWTPTERARALTSLGLDLKGLPPPTLSVGEDDIESASARLGLLGLGPSQPYALVHPFGSTRRQWWITERCGELSTELRELGLATVIVGGAENAEAVAALDLHGATNAVGQLGLRDLMGAMARAHLVIATDSGPFHLAGALSRPTVGLFRSARPEYATLYRQATVLLGEHPACQTKCDWERCAQLPCRQLASITANLVIGAARRAMGRA